MPECSYKLLPLGTCLAAEPAAVLPCYRWGPVAGGPAVPLACCAARLPCRRATVLTCYRWRPAAENLLCRSPAVPLTCCAARLPCRSPAVLGTCCREPAVPLTCRRTGCADAGVILRSLRSGFRGLRLSLPGPGKPSRPESSLLYL